MRQRAAPDPLDREPVPSEAWTHPVAMTSPPIRVETVPVRRAGRWPALLVGLAAVLVGLAIVKPWGGADDGRADPVAPSPLAVALATVVASPAAQVSAPAAVVSADAAPVALLPGQVACDTLDWQLVTLGTLLRWTVRTWTPITPVEASGAADPSIPDLSLGSSDVVGMGACAPSNGSERTGTASRIVAAWRQGAATGLPAAAGGAATGGAAASAFGRVGLADLDRLSAGGLAAATSLRPASVAELVRPFPATQRGRWPAGHYVLLLASPDAGPDRWIAVDIGTAGT